MLLLSLSLLSVVFCSTSILFVDSGIIATLIQIQMMSVVASMATCIIDNQINKQASNDNITFIHTTTYIHVYIYYITTSNSYITKHHVMSLSMCTTHPLLPHAHTIHHHVLQVYII
jgi:hypothetical protein